MKAFNLFKNAALIAVLGVSLIYGTDVDVQPAQDENTPPSTLAPRKPVGGIPIIPGGRVQQQGSGGKATGPVLRQFNYASRPLPRPTQAVVGGQVPSSEGASGRGADKVAGQNVKEKMAMFGHQSPEADKQPQARPRPQPQKGSPFVPPSILSEQLPPRLRSDSAASDSKPAVGRLVQKPASNQAKRPSDEELFGGLEREEAAKASLERPPSAPSRADLRASQSASKPAAQPQRLPTRASQTPARVAGQPARPLGIKPVAPLSQLPRLASRPQPMPRPRPPMAKFNPDTPVVSTEPHLFAAHVCNPTDISISNVDFPTMKPQVTSDSEKKCLPLLNPTGRYNYDKILGALAAKSTEINTHTQAILSELKDNPDSVMTMVANSYSADGKSFNNINFLQILKDAHVDASRVRFLFDLSTKVYYKEAFSKKTNNSSIAYEQEMVEKEGRIAKINATIKRLEEFTKNIDDELAKKNIARLNISDSDEGESAQKVPANVEISPQNGKGAHQHVAIQHLGPKYKIEVQNILPEIIKSLAQNYHAITGDVLPQNISLAELEATLSVKKGSLKKELIEANTALRILKDPNLRDFYAKLEEILKKEARDFTPIDIFYRSAKYSTRFEFLDDLADRKANPENNQKLKEISGVVLLKMDKNPNDKPPVDEFLIVFSGSNSVTDWKHNLNWFKSQGRADHDIATGLRVHGGILDSLHETLTEFGTKFKYWLEKYRSMRPGIKPKLVFTVSGHSLGGALALLMGVFIKQNVTEYYGSDVDVEVKVVTFGAPPMFNERSAQEVEKLIKNKDNLRFWNIGDPVANLSIIQKDTRESRSAIARLLGFYHVGTSIPLFDTRKMAARSEIFNPWEAHLADRYANLLGIDWAENGTQQMEALHRLLQRKGFAEELKLYDPINKLIMFIEDSPDASAKIVGIKSNQVADIIQEHEQGANPLESKIANMAQLQKQRYKQGVVDPLKFTKVDLSQEAKDIEYTQKIKGDFFQTKIKLDRSTSCQFDNLRKIFDFGDKAARYKNMNLDQNARNEISCTCCIVKNTFVSYGAGNIAQKAKDVLRRKNTKTPASILQYCTQEKHCANEDIKKRLFPGDQDIIFNFGRLMESLGIKDKWLTKKVE